MADPIKWASATSQSTGISSASVNAGANQISSAINNDSDLETYATLELTFTCGSAPTANTVWEVYILYAVDGSNYEDGGAAIDPAKNPIGTVAARAVTAAQKQTIENVPLAPFKFKVLLKSELDQDATSVSLLCYTHHRAI